MQLIKAPRDALLKPLATVSGIVERRHTLPILANILIQKEGTRVSFVSTDIEVQIRTHADIGVANGRDSENFATTVAARKLLDILRALPESGEVTLSHTAKKMTVQSGKSRFNLQTLAAEDFPTVSQPESYLASFALPQKTLKHLIAMVHFSMAQQDIRYYLNGLLLVVDGKQVIAVATDGHRLAYCAVETEGVDGSNGASAERHEVIVPRKSILELQRLLGDGDEPVTIDLAANQVRFTFDSIELVSKLVEGKFPDYQRVIPNGYSKSFEIGRDDWLRALQRVAILTSDKFKGVRFVLSEDAVKISSTNADQEDAQDEIEVAYPHGTLDIGFNVSYLLDVLNNLKTDKVTVSVGDANSSALITLPGEEAFKYVVMPMRI
jgi:DNA polymerase-3 subunit beta